MQTPFAIIAFDFTILTLFAKYFLPPVVAPINPLAAVSYTCPAARSVVYPGKLGTMCWSSAAGGGAKALMW